MKQKSLATQTFIEVGCENRLGMMLSPRQELLPPANTTQPDQSFTVSELMEGFVVGRTPSVASHLDYDLDPETVNGHQIPMLTLPQAELYAKQIQERIDSAKKRYEKIQEQIKRENKKVADSQASLLQRVSDLEAKQS